MCKFIHFRKYDANGVALSKGGYTVAFSPIGKDSYAFAIAKCHELDNFNKRTGRNKAAGRLKSKDQWDVLTDCPTEKEFIEELSSIIHEC